MTELTKLKCTLCGGRNFQEGFVQDSGQVARNFVRWIAGPLERGPFGGSKMLGRPRLEVHAFRCTDCTHLELFAYDAD